MWQISWMMLKGHWSAFWDPCFLVVMQSTSFKHSNSPELHSCAANSHMKKLIDQWSRHLPLVQNDRWRYRTLLNTVKRRLARFSHSRAMGSHVDKEPTSPGRPRGCPLLLSGDKRRSTIFNKVHYRHLSFCANGKCWNLYSHFSYANRSRMNAISFFFLNDD